jgi:hypothetical protein
MPASEMTATSVVPPPMSTTMLPVRLGDGQARADGGRHGLLDEVDLAGARALGALFHRALLDLGDAEGHADDDARLHQRAAVVRARDEVAKHRLGDLEVGDDAVAQRADRLDVARACGPSISLASRPTARTFLPPRLSR